MRFPVTSSGRRKAAALASACALVASGLIAGAVATPAYAQTACDVDYRVAWEGGGGFGADITINNLGSQINGWTLNFTFPGTQQVSQGWIANWSQSGNTVTATNEPWSAVIPAGGSLTIGFNGTYTGTNAVPTSFTLNGVTCTGEGGTPPTEPPPTTDPPTEPPPGSRLDNPYVGADVYVNPDWSAAAQAGGAPPVVYNHPTAVWLDRILAIESGSAGPNTMGLADHLDEALAQDAANGSTPLVFQVVIYNLPGRDCAALASNGELAADELDRYESEYIDVIAEILARPQYADLRIVTVIEIDSLPNLITNITPRETATPQCDTMLDNGNYVNGVGYTLAQLGAIPNVYNYIDIGHHGWLGWDDNFEPFAQLVVNETLTANGASPSDLHGFISNVANYGANIEPFFSLTDNAADGPVRENSPWIDFNNYIDEVSYVQGYKSLFEQMLGRDHVSMLIDTSRNGWGGSDRPSGPGSLGDTAEQYVNDSRTDRRIHLGNWCNQAGAGIGERLTVNPEAGVDAYVWIKPPGESDGSSEFIENDEGKGFDEMCDPTYTGNPRNQDNLSGALPDAPISGHWFQAQFDELLANAWPPLN